MDLRPYQGTSASLDDPRLSAVLRENSTFSRSIYRPGTVDWVFFDQAVVLTARTDEALYGGRVPTLPPAAPGRRPFLERIVETVTESCGSPREKAVALLDWVCALPDLYPNPEGDPFHGGTEEEVVRKGSSMCNEQARVLIVLAQLAGLPSRYIGHMTAFNFDDSTSSSGHGVTELFVEGGWAYMDIRGKFFLKPDGSFASTWDLVQDPSRSRWLEAREAARALRVTAHRDLLPQPTGRPVPCRPYVA